MTRWVLWKRGPEVEPLEWFWGQETPLPDSGYACYMARKDGFEIPSDTYIWADPKISQSRYEIAPKRGHNRTAILPWEVDE